MRRRALPLLLAALAALQVCVWWHARELKPRLTVLSEPPRTEVARAMALGDEQFYFRVLALSLQNSGDTFGRFTPLKDYDYQKLTHWFTMLDTLNARSNLVPAMAAYYYSQTQRTSDVRYVVDYLYAHATRDLAHKWWWLVQCTYLAMHRLNDMELALHVARPLLDPSVPAWAQQMLAVIHEKRGEMDNALAIMETIKQNATQITDSDLKYMHYFIEERLNRLDTVSGIPSRPKEE